MSFSIDKCMVISVTLKQTPIPAYYTLHGKQFTAAECQALLGETLPITLILLKKICISLTSNHRYTKLYNFKFKFSISVVKFSISMVKLTLLLLGLLIASNPLNLQRRAAHFVMNDYYQTSQQCNKHVIVFNWNTIESHFKHLRLHKIISLTP